MKLDKKEEGYLFGLFFGDGYKYHDKKQRKYQVEFYLNSERDKEIIKFLESLLKKEGFIPNFRKDKRYSCMRIRVCSKELFNSIDKKVNFSTKTRQFKEGFISGLIDSEGNVNKEKRYIMVTNTDKKLLENVKKILKEMKINSSIKERKLGYKDRKKSYRMYISVNFKRVKHLSIKAGKL